MSVLRFLRRVLVLALLLVLRRRRGRRQSAIPSETPVGLHTPTHVYVYTGTPAREPDLRAELLVLVLLGVGTLCAVAFVVVYALDRLPRHTQLLGLSLGLAFALFAAAAIVFGTRLVAQDEHEENYGPEEHEQDQAGVAHILDETGDRITRKRLLKLAAGGAAGALGIALVTPTVSLGPVLDVGALSRTPWRRDRGLVDRAGRPLRADDIEIGTFYTAFPAGASHDEIGSPLIVVRLEPAELDFPPGRKGWAPEGILAYSKICTHAGCAINLYRTPLFEPTAPRAALVCPCHYSTFDPARGAKVLFGPAGRPLPQLPLEIASGGALRAAGPFSGRIGPAWWGVRRS